VHVNTFAREVNQGEEEPRKRCSVWKLAPELDVAMS
jgi:hypothetical protein